MQEEKYSFNVIVELYQIFTECLGGVFSVNTVDSVKCDNLPYFQSNSTMIQNLSSLSSGVLQIVIFSSGGLLLGFLRITI